MLFGPGQATDTCACDNAPQKKLRKPFDGNTRKAINGDDDGGYFLRQAYSYYKHPLKLN
jgi:hypothetical protein